MADPTYPAKEIAEVRGQLGSPTTAELTDQQIIDAITECLGMYSAFRPIRTYDLDSLTTADDDDKVTPPADSVGVLAVLIDETDAYTDKDAKEWLKDHEGQEDTGTDLVWCETGGAIVFDEIPAGVYPCKIFYKQRHAFSSTVGTEFATGLATLPIRDRSSFLNGVKAQCLTVLAGYAGELTFGTVRISKENIRREGNNGLRSFNRWIRQGYTP